MKCLRKIKNLVILLLPPCKASKFFKLMVALSPIKSSCQSQQKNSLRAFFIESNIILETLQWSFLTCFTFKILFHVLLSLDLALSLNLILAKHTNFRVTLEFKRIQRRIVFVFVLFSC